MPTFRARSWRQLAVRRFARRRALEPVPPSVRDLDPRRLPPLVSPDDDREFQEPLQPAAVAQELEPAC